MNTRVLIIFYSKSLNISLIQFIKRIKKDDDQIQT